MSWCKIYVRSGLEEDGAARGESCSGSPTASGPARLAQVHRAILISLHSGASRHSGVMHPGDHPHHHLAASPFIRSGFSQVPLTVPLSLSACLLLSSSSPHLPLPCPPPSFPGAPLLSRVGEQTGHRELLSRHSHLIQCGTTWLITNPILGPLCVSRVDSVLLSHFIKAITSHFPFLSEG